MQKTATLTEQLHSQQVSDAKNEQDYPKKLDQGSLFLFFSPSALLWPLRKLNLKKIPSYPYWLLYKAATSHYRALFLLPGPLFLLPGPAVGIQILGIPTAKIQTSNGLHACYRYPPELKPSAK
jgi:hypothetical protein